jgi:hypothetical protein
MGVASTTNTYKSRVLQAGVHVNEMLQILGDFQAVPTFMWAQQSTGRRA